MSCRGRGAEEPAGFGDGDVEAAAAVEACSAGSDAAAAPVGQHVYLTGGSNDSGLLATTLRADLAPRTPFFRLGLFGLTVPALSIKGEIGQQLGYIVAGSAAIGVFVAGDDDPHN